MLQICISTLLHNKAMMGADKRSLRLIGRQNILQSFWNYVPNKCHVWQKIYIYTFNRILLVAVVVIESKTRNIYICNVHKKPLCHLIFYLSYGQTQNKKIYKRVLLLRLTLKWNRRQTKKNSKDIIDLVNVLISYCKIYSMSADIFHIFI